MYYVDSNVLIYPALYEGPKAENATAFLRAVVEGDQQAATASLTLDEVIWIISRERSRGAAIDQGERLLKLPNLRVLDVGGVELMRCIKHMRAYEHLTPRDAIHLAAATEHGIHSIVTDDADFEDVTGVTRFGLDDPDFWTD